MIKFDVVIFLLKAEMIERDFEGKKQMPQVATTLTKDVLLSVVGKKTKMIIINHLSISNAHIIQVWKLIANTANTENQRSYNRN
jgi:hypothetical protein